MTQSTQEKLNKIRALIVKLQAKADGTNNEAEQKAFAAKVRQMMEEHGISSTDLSTPVADDEDFGETFSRIDNAYATLLNAVSRYYGAKLYVNNQWVNGKRIQQYKLIGTEGQRIETELYFEYLLNHMNREAQLAYEAEKVIADVMEVSLSKGWKQNFRKAMASTIGGRLEEMKKEENPVSDADQKAVATALATMKFHTRSHSGAHGAGAQSGAAVGSTTSLNRQAGAAGRGGRALAGY